MGTGMEHALNRVQEELEAGGVPRVNKGRPMTAATIEQAHAAREEVERLRGLQEQAVKRIGNLTSALGAANDAAETAREELEEVCEAIQPGWSGDNPGAAARELAEWAVKRIADLSAGLEEQTVRGLAALERAATADEATGALEDAQRRVGELDLALRQIERMAKEARA